MTPEEFRLWTRAALALQDLPLSGPLDIQAPGIGGKNYILTGESSAGPFLLKLRRHPREGVEQERRALALLPPDLGPPLLDDDPMRSTLSPWALLTEAIGQKDLDLLHTLDLPVGEGLLLRRLPGAMLSEQMEQWDPETREQRLEQLGRVVARLHQLPLDGELPPAQFFPKRPTAMLRVMEDLLAEIHHRGLLQEEALAAIEEALGGLSGSLQGRQVPEPHEALCHGDIQWHNLLLDGDDLWLIDLEDASIGDPAIDLAMMVCRTPMSWFEELQVLDGYAAQGGSREVLERYFVIAPFVGLLCALGGLLDLADVWGGARPIAGQVPEFLRSRFPSARQELGLALLRILGPGFPLPDLYIQEPESLEPVRCLVAIDGPAASFKSPFARGLAQELGLPYYNKGAAFRYVALWAHCQGSDPAKPRDRQAVAEHLHEMDVELLAGGAVQIGSKASGSWSFDRALLLPQVEEQVAAWAACEEIREALAPTFARLLEQPAVIEGRDVGTELAPHADVKLYLQVPLELRAEALARRAGIELDAARQQIEARDKADRKRKIAPLRKAKDARVVRLHPDALDQSVLRWAGKIREGK